MLMKRKTVKRKITSAAALLLILVMALFGLTGCMGTTGSKVIPLTPTVSPPTVSKNGTLVVGVDSTRAPYAGFSKGNLVGIDVDVAAALADQLGLKLELVDTSGKSADSLLQAGTVDVIMDVEQSGASITQGKQIGPYVISGPALFMSVKGTTVPTIDLTTLSGATIVAQKDSLSAWTVDNIIGKGTSSPVNNLQDALKAVSDGTATYAAADAIVGSYLATNFANVACVKLFPQSSIGVYLAVNQNNTQLADALTNALRTVRDNGELPIILTKWLGAISASVVASTEAVVTKDTTAAPSTSSGTVDLGNDLPDPSLAGGTDTTTDQSNGGADTTSGDTQP